MTGLAGCNSEPKGKAIPEAPVEEGPKVVEVHRKSMECFAPDTIPSGRNAFVYKNRSTEPHFILLDKYPEGGTIENTVAEVAPAFEEGMQRIMQGRDEEAMGAFGKLPESFANMVYFGGTGLVSPQGNGQGHPESGAGRLHHGMLCAHA